MPDIESVVLPSSDVLADMCEAPVPGCGETPVLLIFNREVDCPDACPYVLIEGQRNAQYPIIPPGEVASVCTGCDSSGFPITSAAAAAAIESAVCFERSSLAPSPPPPSPPSPPPVDETVTSPPAPPPTGCTDPRSINYKSFYIVDDGSCTIGGCPNEVWAGFETPAFWVGLVDWTPYDPEATFDDGTCPVAYSGCMNPDAVNYASFATVSAPAECLIYGCTDPAALNFVEGANFPGPCEYEVPGCMDPDAFNYFPAATVQAEDGPNACLYVGCVLEGNPAYDEKATILSLDMCEPTYAGCTDPAAINYDAIYNQDDGTCILPGCTQPDNAAGVFTSGANLNVQCYCDGTCELTLPTPVVEPIPSPSPAPSTRRLAAQDILDDSTRRLQETSCSFPLAANYDRFAPPGAFAGCTFDVNGCTDSDAFNYNPEADAGDSSLCQYLTFGCTDPVSLNFDEDANANDGSCIVRLVGCMDSASKTYLPAYNEHAPASCLYDVVGCTVPTASNFNSLATVSTVDLCVFDIEGCRNPAALNYLPVATKGDEGLCVLPGEEGCKDPAADNYNPEAAIHKDEACVVVDDSPSPPPPAPVVIREGDEEPDVDEEGDDVSTGGGSSVGGIAGGVIGGIVVVGGAIGVLYYTMVLKKRSTLAKTRELKNQASLRDVWIDKDAAQPTLQAGTTTVAPAAADLASSAVEVRMSAAPASGLPTHHC